MKGENITSDVEPLQHKPEVTDEAWIEQRHYTDLDGSDAAFTHMFDQRVSTETHAAGVAV